MNATQALIPDITQTSRQLAARLPANLSETELSAVLEAAEILEAYIKQARTEAEARLNAGQSVMDWELLKTEGRRSVPDAVKAARQLAPLLEPHEFLACCKPALGALIEAVKEAEGVTEAQAKDIVAEYLKGNIVKGPGGEKLSRKPKAIILDGNSTYLEEGQLHRTTSDALAKYAQLAQEERE